MGKKYKVFMKKKNILAADYVKKPTVYVGFTTLIPFYGNM
jgi:hypothetical protein